MQLNKETKPLIIVSSIQFSLSLSHSISLPSSNELATIIEVDLKASFSLATTP